MKCMTIWLFDVGRRKPFIRPRSPFIIGGHPSYWDGQAVPIFWQRFNVLWVLGRVLERLAELLNGCVDTQFEVNEGVFRPQGLTQFSACNHPSFSLQQQT